jgi:uncharacterized protein (TIGR00251 family)
MVSEAIRRSLSEGREHVDLRVYVRPESREERLVLEEGELVFHTVEPPVKGRANAALVKYLSRVLRIPSSRIEIVHGARSRSKVVRIHGLSADKVVEALSRELGGGHEA